MSLALGAFAACLNPKTFRLVAHTAHCTNTPNAGKPQRSGSQEKPRAVAHYSVRCCCAQKRYRAPASSSSVYPFFVGNPHRNRACRAQPNNNNNPQNRETNIQHHTHTHHSGSGQTGKRCCAHWNDPPAPHYCTNKCANGSNNARLVGCWMDRVASLGELIFFCCCRGGCGTMER